MWRIRGVLPAVAMITALSLGGCASGSGGEAAGGAAATGSGLPTAVSPPATRSPAATGRPPAVPQTLAFSAPMVGGGRFDGASLAGKPAVLWFWAAWCPRCRAKADDVASVQAAYVKKVNFLGVAGLGSGVGAMERFVADYGLTGFPHVADDEGVVWRRFGVTEQEYFVILDASGKVVDKGALSNDQLRQRVKSLAG